MNNSTSTGFVVNSCELPCNGIYCKTILMSDPCSTMIYGTIFNSNRTPSSNAVIEVTEYNPCTNTRLSLGFTFTDNFGRYAFPIFVNPDAIYEFTVYSSLQ